MKLYDFPQYSLEWWTIRRGMPTASNFKRIITPAKWQPASGAHTYMCELLGSIWETNYGAHEEYVNNAMMNGTIMEPRVRALYRLETGNSVSEVGFCVSDCGRWGCSPDGLVGDEGLIELKSPTPTTQIQWFLAGTVPDEHLAQCHGALIVTGRKWCDFLSYVDGLPPLLIRVEPNELTEKLRAGLEQFSATLLTLYQDICQRHQQPEKPPLWAELPEVEIDPLLEIPF